MTTTARPAAAHRSVLVVTCLALATVVVGRRLAQRRDPVDRPRHPRHPDPAVLDDRRLRPGLRRPAAAGRRDRRPLRPAPGAARRPRDLRRRVRGRDDGQPTRLADRDARPARASAPRWSCRPRCPRSPAPSRPPSGAQAVGAWAGVAGASAILGLLASGVLLEVWSWRSVFGLNVVLAVAAIVGTLRVVPESADPTRPELDLVGALITRRRPRRPRLLGHRGADTRAGSSARTLVGIATGLVLLGGVRRLGAAPARRRCSTRGCSATARSLPARVSITLQFFAFFGFIFLVLQYLQLVRGESPLVVGAQHGPDGAGDDAGRAGGWRPELAARVGAMRACLLGLLLIAAGTARPLPARTPTSRTGCCSSACCRSVRAWGWP